MLDNCIVETRNQVANFLGIDHDLFQREYWHKKPLHVKNQVKNTDFTASITLNNIVGLFNDAYTCGNEIYAGFKANDCFYKAWGLFDYMKKAGINTKNLTTEEFKEAVLSCLAKENDLELDANVTKHPWAVVLKYADYKNNDLARLRSLLSALENWSMVDVAVAYALDNGSVGAHVDSSASIHLMVEGKKQVRIGKRYNPDEIPDDDLLLLKEQLSNELEPSYEFLLEPGDILYLPECYAHEFTAVDGDAISYIASFQSAPTWRAINHFANFSKERGKSLGAFYQDSNSINHENPAEVKKDFIDEVKSSFMGLINDDSLLNEWFGSFVTQQDVNHDLTERQSGAYQLLKKKKLALVKAGKLQVNSYLRFAPIKVAFSTVGDGYRLFAGGSYIDLPPESLTLCKKLAAAETVNLDDLGGSRKLLQFLLQNKAVA